MNMKDVLEKASPRPWAVNQELLSEVLGSDGGDIGEFVGLRTGEAEDDANAALTARAVNCHEPLVGFVELFLEWHTNDGHEPALTYDELVEAARAALAKARGGE